VPGKKYGKPASHFEIWNIGNYETVYWQERQDEYFAFMLKLYQAQLLRTFRYLHVYTTCPVRKVYTK